MRGSGLFGAIALLLAATAPGSAGETAPITENADEIFSALESASWIHKPGQGGRVLYVMTFRTCGPCIEFKEAELDRLLDAGVDVRFVVFPPWDEWGEEINEPGEIAMIAELWKTRSWDLYLAWYAMSAPTYYRTQTLPPSAASGERAALVARSRKVVLLVEDALKPDGVGFGFPGFFWKDKNGQPMVHIGYSANGFRLVRDSVLGK